MSIISSICAERDRKVVKEAVDAAMKKATTEEAKKLLQEVWEYCEALIQE